MKLPRIMRRDAGRVEHATEKEPIVPFENNLDTNAPETNRFEIRAPAPQPDRFHNLTAADLGLMVFQAQERLRLAQDDLDACKLSVIGISKGAKMEIAVPNLGRVVVTPPRLTERKRYTVDAEKFDNLDINLRQQLLQAEVIQEPKRSDEPATPTVRIIPR